LAAAESKLDQIQREVNDLTTDQNDTASQLGKFRDLALRMRIEADLLRDPTTDRIGMFELPAVQGGFLELAITIVQETIAKRGSAGANMTNAMKEFAKAQTDYNNR